MDYAKLRRENRVLRAEKKFILKQLHIYQTADLNGKEIKTEGQTGEEAGEASNTGE